MFRKATLGDLSKLIELDKEIVDYHHGIDSLLWKNSKKYPRGYFSNFWRDKIFSKNVFLYLILENEIVVGYFLGYTEKGDIQFNLKKKAVIDRVYLQEKFRNKGYTKQVFALFKQWAKKNKSEGIFLRVESRNYIAVKAWEALGFQDYVKGMWRGI